MAGIEGLRDMLGIDADEDPEHQVGSALNPASISGNKKEEEDIAKPNT